jgi:hypothetical protein
VTSDGVVGDTETALVMQLMEQHVDPSAVLLVPCLVGVSGALLQNLIADLPINMLLLEDVLICEVNLRVEVLKAGSLPEAHELVVHEAILDVVELVDVVHNFLTLFLYKVLDKNVSANGNPKANVAVIYKSLGGEQGTEVCEGGISSEQALCGRVRLGSRDTLDENLGLIIEVQASIFPENVLDVREHLELNGEFGLDVTIVCVSYYAGILVMLGEGASP